jgi:4-amino-4-deoxy-L-arabinose transferase-like glycosyltransferase
VVLAGASLVLHLLANGHYGFFRDELYFIVCGERLDWGYVDQPALVPLLASWSHALFGDFLLGFRLLPALAMTATVAPIYVLRGLQLPLQEYWPKVKAYQ